MGLSKHSGSSDAYGDASLRLSFDGLTQGSPSSLLLSINSLLSPGIQLQVFIVSNSHTDLFLSQEPVLSSEVPRCVSACATSRLGLVCVLSLRTSAAFGASVVFDSYRPLHMSLC